MIYPLDPDDPRWPRMAVRIGTAAHGIFNAEGARLLGGRWNRPGIPALYASSNYSLALLEVLVRARIGRPPPGRLWSYFTPPPQWRIDWLNEDELPGWHQANYLASQRAGSAWLAASEAVILSVPSAVARFERNLLINPAHPVWRSFAKPSMTFPVIWDKRLFA